MISTTRIHTACISGAAGGIEARQAFFHGRQFGEGGVRLGLIPVGDGVEVVGAVVGVAVFDGGFEGFGEGDGRVEMEAVDAGAAAGCSLPTTGAPYDGVGEGMAAEVPCAEEVVFGAGAVDGGSGFAVDEEHIVAFAEPHVLILQYGHGDAYEVAFAGGFHPDVVVFAVEVFLVVDGESCRCLPVVGPALVGGGLAILRVEVEGVGGQRFGVAAVVDVVVERVYFFLPSLVTVMRAFLRKGIWKKLFSALSEATESGADS
jgi:hypothetical protein